MAIINPQRGKNEKRIPQSGILLVNPVEAKSCIDTAVQQGAKRRFLFNSSLCVDTKRDFFMAGPAIGSPAAVMVLEKLIALGAKQVLLCGWCGAVASELEIGDVLVPQRAVIGEGTSQYYNYKEESFPSKSFADTIVKSLAIHGIAAYQGAVWSTDAVYREEREYLLALHKSKGVDAVDMECSALCSVAAFRGIEFAAVLVVSDITCGERWQPGQKKDAFRQRTDMILALCCCGEFFVDTLR